MPPTPRDPHPLLRRAALAATLLLPAFSSPANTTTWTGAAANLLWADPANWSDGLPSPSSDALIPSIAPATIDLGGQPRPVDSLTLLSSTTLSNGTLVANQIISPNHFAGSPPPSIATSLTSASPSLRLLPYARNTDLRIDGPIVGSGFDLFAGGTLTAPSTYTGRTIAPMDVPVTFQDAGSALDSSSFDVAFRLTLRNVDTASTDRLNDAAPVRLYASELQFLGTADLPVTERVASLQLMTGPSTLALSDGSSLHAATLLQHPGAVLTIARSSSAAGSLLLDSPPTLIGGPATSPGAARPVVPFVLTGGSQGSNPSLTTYDAGALRALDPDTEFDLSLPSSPTSPAPNVRLPLLTTASSPATVNSLVVDQGLTLTSAATLTVNSGALLLRGNAKITGDGALVSPADLFVYTPGNVSAAVDVPIHAPSLTVTGRAYLSHPNDISSLTVNGDLHLSDARALGSGPVRVTDSLFLDGPSSYTIPNDISLGPLYRPLDTPPARAGLFDHRINLTLGKTVTLDGHLTGDSDAFSVTGDGTLRLNGDATFASLYLDLARNVTLEVNGTLSSDHPDPAARPAAITIAGRVRGNGTILGTVWTGDLSPGPDQLPGRLAVSDLDAGLTLSLDIAGPNPDTDFDQLVVLHAFPQRPDDFPSLTANLTYAPPPGTQFLVLDFQGLPALPPHFRDLPEGATLLASNGTPLQISYLAGDGNDVSLTVLPEPATLLPLLLASLPFTRRRRPSPSSFSHSSFGH